MRPHLPDTVARLRLALADQYVLERELTGGGMSRVFVAREAALGRQVVIKILPPELAAELSTDRFRREIQLAASLQHPHIVPLLSAAQADNLLYYTMPLIEGESLRAKLAREGELPVNECVRILRDVVDALSYAHRHGVVHRDIKPDNVLLSDHHAMVTDFGVAKALDQAAQQSLTGTGLALGTPTYMAPEQAAADPHSDQRADIYAVGVLGYEILAGRPPFSGPSAQAIIAAHLSQKPLPLAEVRPSVPPALAALIMRCLEKRPADRWQTAAELLDATESLSAPSDRSATQVVTASLPGQSARKWLLPLLALGAGLLVAAAGWLLFRRSRTTVPLDNDLVAVAPFDVPDSKLTLWREGLVDILSRNLDGAGPLRSVPPTTVIRRWSGRADRLSAAQLGRRTGARLVVFGTLTGTGPDSARLAATAFDVGAERPLADIEIRDAADRIDRLADSLTVRLLRELGRTHRIEAFRAASLGSTSLPALKAFLQGEQWFRRAAWDSALGSFERALALDSTFPLALRRVSQVYGWRRTAFDSLGNAMALRAGALNHGLARRDSLLVTADSLFSSLFLAVPVLDLAVIRRAHAVAAELTQAYPDDFESWYALGEAHYHFASSVGSSPHQALEAFDRAIAIDSSFAPAYIHPIELATWLEGPGAGHKYASAYLKLAPADVVASGIRLADELMGASGGISPRLAERVQNASPEGLFVAWLAVRRAPDSAEAVVQITRALAAAPAGDAPWLTSVARRNHHGASLLYRGHVRQAVQILFQDPSGLPPRLVEAAILSRTAPDSAGPLFRSWLKDGPPLQAASALPWWTSQRDSAPIQELARRSDSLTRSLPSGIQREVAAYFSEAAPAYLALVGGDTAAALRRLEALPDSLCPLCYFERLTLAQLLSATNQDEKASTLLDSWLTELLVPSEVIWTLERARVAERMGDREKAARDYQYVADVWRNADAELQPYVSEARSGLARVTAEPR